MLKRLYSYMNGYKKYVCLASLCVIIEVAFELVIPLIMSNIIDVGVAHRDKTYIIGRGIFMCLLALAALLSGSLYARFAALCGQGLGSGLRKAQYSKIQSFSFSNTDHFTTSSLVTRLTSDVTVIQNTVSTGLRPVIRAPIMMLMGLGLSFFINARLALVFLAALPILGVCLFLIIRRVRPLYSRMQKAVDLVNRIVRENLTAVRTVKAYVREEHEIGKFAEVNDSLQSVSDQAFRTSSLNMPAMQFVMYGTIISILWFGNGLISVGDMQVGRLTGFLSYVMQILNSLMMISNIFLMLTRSLASGRRILEVLDTQIDITDRPAAVNGQSPRIEKGDIEFRKVCFKYDKNAPEYVLSDISFHIRPGQTVGVIGGTGSAKTTLVQLIPRLYDASEGEILLDGRPITDYTLEHLRDAIAVVLQKNTLFSGTIAENLRWGKKDAGEAELRQACQTACADTFIENLPLKYGTMLDQGGVNLSGGQRQRLCIARAILKNPRILILDDSTSAVDTATEANIRAGLEQSLPGAVKIIIAQRITSVLQADQVIILDDGRIHAIGTHEALLKKDSIYQEIYYSQLERSSHA